MNHSGGMFAAGVLALALAASIMLAVVVLSGPAEAGAEPPAGQITWAVHFTIAPTLFEPAETPGLITPFMMLYALHDAMLKPMPGKHVAPSLAESWSMSPDGLVYEFVLRKGVRFHNGEPVTAEDVKFSFERYRGISAKVLKDKVAAIETPDPGRVRFKLKQPWPDFITFYGTPATGAGWIVPKKYVELVGIDGFKKAPIGTGPYKFVSFRPGVELVLEAFEGYWRQSENKSPQDSYPEKIIEKTILRLFARSGFHTAWSAQRDRVWAAAVIRARAALKAQPTGDNVALVDGRPVEVRASDGAANARGRRDRVIIAGVAIGPVEVAVVDLHSPRQKRVRNEARIRARSVEIGPPDGPAIRPASLVPKICVQ